MVIAAPEGHKTSTLGIIPNNWECKMLQDGLSAKPEYGANASAIQPVANDFIRYIRITDIDESGRLIQNGAKALSEGEAEGFILEEDDILIARTGNTVGKSMRYTADMGLCAFAGYLIRFKLDTFKLQPKFVSQFLRSDIFWEWVQKSIKVGAQPNINAQQYQAMPIVFPPLPEQKKIARILSSVDSKLALIDQQITTTQTLKKGLMQKLFTQGVGTQDADGRWQPHTDFQETELGRVPVGWAIEPLSSLCKKQISYGIVQTGEPITNGIPCVRVVDLSGQIDINSMITTSREISDSYSKTILELDDIMFALRGDIGLVKKVGPILVGCNLTRGIALLSPANHIFSDYLLWAIRSECVREGLLKKVNGSALQEIPLTELRKIAVPIPDMKEQQEIARILSTIDRKLDHLQTQKAQTQQLKKGLMQKLLTGQIRVQPDPQDH